MLSRSTPRRLAKMIVHRLVRRNSSFAGAQRAFRRLLLKSMRKRGMLVTAPMRNTSAANVTMALFLLS